MKSFINNFNKKYLIIVFTLLAIGIGLYKASHCYITNDEEFYVAEGIRILYGHKLLIDDWHIAQMIGIFNFPFIYLYSLFNVNYDGIIYFLRIVYLIFQIIVGLVFYCRFKEYKEYSALASFILMVFSPKSIRTISYYSISILFLILSYCIYDIKLFNDKINFFISGMFYSFAVQNTPYLAILLPIFIYIEIKHKNSVFILGVLLSVVLFYLFFLRNSKFTDILYCFQFLFDSSHSTPPLMNLINCGARFLVEFYPYVIVFVISILMIKISKINPLIGCFISSIFGIIFILLHGYQSNLSGWDIILIPTSLFGLVLYFSTDKRFQNRKLLFGLLISFSHAILFGASSNTGLRGLAGPLVFATSISILLIHDYLRSSVTNSKCLLNFSIIYIVFVCFVISYNTIYFNFGNIKNYELDTRYNSGPLKYIYSSNKEVEITYTKIETIKSFVNDYEGKYDYVWFLTYNSYPYYLTNANFLTMSTYNYAYRSKEIYMTYLRNYLKMHRNIRILYIFDVNNDYNIQINDLDNVEEVQESNGMISCVINSR